MIKNIVYLFLLLSPAIVFGQAQNDTINRLDKNDLRTGYWKKDYRNGNPRYEGYFKAGVPVGEFKRYTEEGELKASLQYSEHGKKASARLYYPSGSVMAEGIYMEEKKEGSWKFFAPDNSLKIEESYMRDRKHGKSTEFYRSGQPVQIQNWRNDTLHGEWKQYFEDGKLKGEGNYENGDLHGEVKYYHPDGKIKIKGNYNRGLRSGGWNYYDGNGQLRAIELFKGGYSVELRPMNGEFTEYYPGEIPREVVNYRGGKKHGEWKQYYEAGEWQVERTTLEDGTQDAKQVLVGQKLKLIGSYFNDELNGDVTYYNEDGSVEKIEHYKMGELVENRK